MTAFEALRAYVESRNVAVAGVKDVIRTARVVARGPIKLHSVSSSERRVVALLWHLGLVAAHFKSNGGKRSLWVSPTPLLYRIAEGCLTPLAVRVARWTPMRLLLRYMISRGGSATAGDVEKDLSNELLKITRTFLPVLKFAYSKFGPVKKPYNRHMVEAVLFKLGSELGLLTLENRSEASVTELAYELLEEPPCRGSEDHASSPPRARSNSQRYSLIAPRLHSLALDRPRGR